MFNDYFGAEVRPLLQRYRFYWYQLLYRQNELKRSARGGLNSRNTITTGQPTGFGCWKFVLSEVWVNSSSLQVKQDLQRTVLKVREEPRSYDVCLLSRSVPRQNRRQLRQANSGKDAEAQQERTTKWDNNQENDHTQFLAKYIASWWSVKPVRQPSVSKIVIVKLHERELNPILARLFWAPAARGGGTLCPLLKTMFLFY